MTAQEAREVSQSAQLGLLSLAQCLDIVKASSYLGHTQVVLPSQPSSIARKYLLELGYGYTELQRRLIW